MSSSRDTVSIVLATNDRITQSARVLQWGSGVFASIALSLLLASTAFTAALVGRPFHRSWTLTHGALVIEWMTPEANGSLSGFGNPGWKLTRSGSNGTTFEWRPKLSVSRVGTYHKLTFPLWPVVLGLTAAWWYSRRVASRRTDPSCCGNCGYSRSGLDAKAKCPECGLIRRWLRTSFSRLNRAIRRQTGPRRDGTPAVAHPS